MCAGDFNRHLIFADQSSLHECAHEGLREPIDLLEVDGQLWGFNGCHRVAAHERLGLPTIRARIRQATTRDLNLHLR